jgi:hypothetical protein
MPGVGIGISPAFMRRGKASMSGLGGALVAWYKHDSVALDGSDVTALLDKSAGGRNLTANSAPQYSASGGANDSPYVQLDGSDDYFRSAANGFVESRQLRVFLVCRPQGTAAANQTLFDGHVTNTMRVYTASTSSLGMFVGTAITRTSTLTAWQLIEANFKAADPTLRVNDGAAGATASGFDPNVTALTIGAAGGLIQPIAMRFAEMVITHGETSDQVDFVRDLLNAEYGLWS